MTRITPYIVSIIIFVFTYSLCFAQMDVSVRASINRDKIIIGESLELKLEASMPLGTAATWFPLDSVTHFEFIDKGKIDTVIKGDAITYRQTLLITSFDSGRWSVPSFPLTIGNKDYLTDSLPVSVAYANFDPRQDYHDIKDIIEVENTATRYISWVLLVVALFSLLAVIYFLRKKGIKPIVVAAKKPASQLSPLQEAMQALEQLQQNGYAIQTNSKFCHIALNDILRTYLYRKTTIATMEKTSAELMLQLKQFNLPAADFTLLAQVLRMNDAVKFAKYQPTAQENAQAIETIKQDIAQLDAIIN